MNTLQGSYKAADNTLQLNIRDFMESRKFKNQALTSGQRWYAVGQLVIGTVSTISGLITLLCSLNLDETYYQDNFSKKCKAISKSSFGLWSGVIYIVTGALGVYRGGTKQLQTPFYIGFSIVSCVTSASGMIIIFFYFAFCSGCTNNNDGLTAVIFFRYTCYAVVIIAHSNGMTFSIIGASFSCCRMQCCDQSTNMEALMSQLQDDAGPPVAISTCPKPPVHAQPPCHDKVEYVTGVEQIYFEADNEMKNEPLSYISVEEDKEDTVDTAPVKKPEKPSKRYLGLKLLSPK